MIVDQSHREAAGTVNAFSRAPTRMLGYFVAHLLSGVDWERHLRLPCSVGCDTENFDGRWAGSFTWDPPPSAWEGLRGWARVWLRRPAYQTVPAW